jgi:hypothetical protein
MVARGLAARSLVMRVRSAGFRRAPAYACGVEGFRGFRG